MTELKAEIKDKLFKGLSKDPPIEQSKRKDFQKLIDVNSEKLKAKYEQDTLLTGAVIRALEDLTNKCKNLVRDGENPNFFHEKIKVEVEELEKALSEAIEAKFTKEFDSIKRQLKWLLPEEFPKLQKKAFPTIEKILKAKEFNKYPKAFEKIIKYEIKILNEEKKLNTNFIDNKLKQLEGYESIVSYLTGKLDDFKVKFKKGIDPQTLRKILLYFLISITAFTTEDGSRSERMDVYDYAQARIEEEYNKLQ